MQNGDNASRRWLSSSRDVANGKKYPFSLSFSLFLFSTREENRFDGKRGTGIPRRSLSGQSRSSSTINKKSSDRSSFVHVPDHVQTGFLKDLHAKLSRAWSWYRLSMHRFIDRLDHDCILVSILSSGEKILFWRRDVLCICRFPCL